MKGNIWLVFPSLCQFWCGEWPLQLQPAGPSGLSRLRSGPSLQLSKSQPAAGVLPVPLRQWLWSVTQVHVTELLHRLWTVSKKYKHEGSYSRYRDKVLFYVNNCFLVIAFDLNFVITFYLHLFWLLWRFNSFKSDVFTDMETTWS